MIAQEGRVLLSEEKTGKRIVLVAENTTKDTLNVFLRVVAEGYRRSGDRPVLKNIAPFSKVPMITLIELTDKASSYTYDLIVDDKENNMNFKLVKKEKDIEKVIKGKRVLFTMDDCEKCTLLSAILESENINHRVFNISEDSTLYKQFMAFIGKDLTEETRIDFPVIWNKDHAIFGFNDLEKIVNELK